MPEKVRHLKSVTIPIHTQAERAAITSPLLGRIGWNLDSDVLEVYNGDVWSPGLPNWDAVLEPGESISSAISGGATSILLLNGTFPLSSTVSITQGGVNLIGVTREGVIIDGGGTLSVGFDYSNSSGVVANMTFQNFDSSSAPVGVRCFNASDVDVVQCTFNSGIAVGAVGTVSLTEGLRVFDCIFDGSLDFAGTGSISIGSFVVRVLVVNCRFLTDGSGAAILSNQSAAVSTQKVKIGVHGCEGNVTATQGFFRQADGDVDSSLSITGNNISCTTGPWVNIVRGGGIVSGNVFESRTNALADSLVLGTGGEGIIVGSNFLDGGSKATDIIEVAGNAGHQVTNNIFVSAVTNAIHLTSAGDNAVVSNNTMKGQALIIDAGAANSVIALNILNTLTNNETTAGDNEVARNITGVS